MYKDDSDIVFIFFNMLSKTARQKFLYSKLSTVNVKKKRKGLDNNCHSINNAYVGLPHNSKSDHDVITTSATSCATERQSCL